MAPFSPLLDALERVHKQPSGNHGHWNGAAVLYTGALLQMYKTAPGNKKPAINLPAYLPSLGGFVLENAKNSAEIQNLCKGLIPDIMSLEPDECSLIAAELVGLLGARLYAFLKHVLSADPQGLEWLENSLFHHSFDGQKYSLILAHTSDLRLEEAFRPDLPPNGWTADSKVFPPFVRIVPWEDSTSRPKIYYLFHKQPQTDEQLDKLDNTDGLRLAALSLSRDLVFPLSEPGTGEDGNRLVRFQEPEKWPANWQDTLTSQILECSKKRVAIAVMPELSVSGEMQKTVRRALGRCDNGFPALLVAGSWHENKETGKDTDRFVNKSPLIGCHFPQGTILTHIKFEIFSHKGIREGNITGSKGFTYLVTSLGIIAIGICKDWFVLRPEGTTIAFDQFNKIRPILGLIPTFTSTTKDLLDLAVPLKETGCILVAANNCGTVRNMFRNDECCMIERRDQTPRRDIRSFISVPKAWYLLKDGHTGDIVTESANGLFTGRAPCGGTGGSELDSTSCNLNTVLSWIMLKNKK